MSQIDCSVDCDPKFDPTSLVALSLDTWPEELMRFGIAILVTDPENRQLHTAVLYRIEDGPLMIGDVQSHCQARRVAARPSESAFWIGPDLDVSEQRMLAALADSWLEKNPDSIPYSVASPGGVIFKDSVWIGNDPGQGLTCATFVVALFEELGFPFLTTQPWGLREGDEEWAQRILAMLAANMDPEHRDAQYKRIGEARRVRPADVAAAAQLMTRDMSDGLKFEQVVARSASIEKELLTT